MRQATEEPEIKLWRVPSVPDLTVKRIERMRRARSNYSEDYAIVVLQAGAYESWYRGELRTHGAGELRLKGPGQVSRGSRVLEPVTMQIAAFAPSTVEQAAAAVGRQGSLGFGTSCLLPGSRAAKLGFAHETFDRKVTLDALAAHAGLDKYHLVRAFRRAVGLPPYEYLTHLRIARASSLLARGVTACEVAQVVGLYDESQLSRHFRRIVGTTPGRYAHAMSAAPSCQHHPMRARAAAASFGS